jgi:putative cardiolipin synthase
LLGGCASTLPPPEGRSASTALADTDDTRLGRSLGSEVAAHPGLTGIHPLMHPRDAIAARVLLAAAAERSLDVQYYIWHGDEAGFLLFESLWHAAERGVRVRLLLDDNNTKGLDPTLAVLDAHPHIEVRLYNPFVQRGARWLAYATDFERLNRRMHNKSFTADQQAAIVGGRNIGNEYFALGSGVVFADLDVIAVGAAVRDVSTQFDRYWNSASAYPASQFVGAPPADGVAQLEARFAAMRTGRESAVYAEAVRTTSIVRDLLARQLAFEWAPAQLVADDPAKTLDTQERAELLMFPKLVRTMGQPKESFDLVSPYFVPGDDGTASLVALAQGGVKVRVLTNSLAASDVGAVHAGYSKRRHDLLRAGIRLFELQPTAGQQLPKGSAGHGSSVSAGLHAKTSAVDRQRYFVGSFNFDLRSALLNTEMGLVIDSPALAQRVADGFDTTVPLLAYEVRLAPDGQHLQWIERNATGETVHDTEPGTGLLRRLGVGLLSLLPIDWLL